jgi:hypothetical protein
MLRSVVCGLAVIVLIGCSESSDITAPDDPLHTTRDTSQAYPSQEGTATDGDSDTDQTAADILGTEYVTRLEATLFETAVAAGPLNVREGPSLSSEVIDRLDEGTPVIVAGLSARVDNIDNHEGRWVLIADVENRDWAAEPIGWVFSKYIAGAEELVPREMKIIGLTGPEEGRAQMLRLTLDGVEHQVFKHKLDSQDFYTFVWTADQRGFSYNDVPGTYIWRSGEAEAELITYKGSRMESAWVAFTDDFKYMFQDFGTGPGVRGLGVVNLHTGDPVPSGGYLVDINLEGYSIDTVVSYSEWRLERGYVDDESIRHAEAFMETNPEPPKDPRGFSNLLVVKYRLNVDTGEREYRGSEWILTQ